MSSDASNTDQQPKEHPAELIDELILVLVLMYGAGTCCVNTMGHQPQVRVGVRQGNSIYTVPLDSTMTLSLSLAVSLSLSLSLSRSIAISAVVCTDFRTRTFLRGME